MSDNHFSHLNDKKLALFFTFGNGLEMWQKVGMLERELAIYRALAETLNTIYLVTYQEHDAEFQNILPKNIIVLPKNYPIPNILYSCLIPFIYARELRTCDLLKTNQLLGSWSAMLAKLFFHKKLIVRTGYTASQFYVRAKKYLHAFGASMLEHFAFLFADAFVVASEDDQKWLKQKQKTTVIPNYVDTDFLYPYKKMEQEEISLLFVGRLEEQKNLFALFEALKGFSHVKLSVVGSGSLREPLENFAKANHLPVQFLGNVPFEQLKSYYQSTTMFVLPSYFEGTPKVLLEAMSCGLPVIASDVQGIQNIITHEKNGFLCSTDSASIANAIRTLSQNVHFQETLGQNARTFILENFSLRSVLEKELSLYDQILTKIIR